MPTTHVESGADELLQTVADFLLKSRKIVVVTGAGISTNSGIPDFRSENGLYSLIQAQYDTAAKQLGKKGENESNDDENEAPLENDTHERDAKRQRDSQYVRIEAECESLEELSCKTQDEIRCANNRHVEEPELPSRDAVEDSPPTATEEQPVPNPQLFSTPKPNRMGPSEDQLDTSPLSSPPPDELIIPPSTFRLPRQQLVNVNFPLSSSPLSSPPPVLFDPFEPNSPSDASSGRRSSTSMSEVDETSPSSSQLLFTSSQTSNSGRNALPNMKGRDLFDASIWTDPLRTSVFYTFATSLRHKIKEAEPTGSHRFISHLRDRGKLVRCYTQNIDQIEEKVGLSTSLIDGPGSRGRFSRRSTANTNQLAKMVEEVAIAENGGSSSSEIPLLSQKSHSSSPDSSQMQQTEEGTLNDQAKNAVAQRDTARTGVECVFLHGSLQLLRCFLCARVCSWEDDDRELETLYGQQPECPHCAGATAARQERGKRALGVGKLRPDIVLYGEEHPNAHLISPIVTHDLALYPDMMLILGTSLRVHGLKIMVREFAKTVHSKGGKVVFVNFTKPPESSWGDTIDYWVEWDCDAWVADLKERIPKLWQEPEPKQPKKIRPPAANPVALRDTKVTGAYWTSKVLSELQRVTGKDESPRRATLSALPSQVLAAPVETPLVEQVRKVVRPKPRRSRQSAPGALEKPKQQGSTLNPNHDRTRKSLGETTPNAGEIVILSSCDSSILDSVKANPRRRKRKMIDGEEVCIPKIGTKKGANKNESMQRRAYQLPPLRPQGQAFAREKPQPMEPSSPPSGPLATLSVNLRSATSNRQGQSSKMDLKFTLSSEVVKGLTWPLESPPAPAPALAPQPRRSVPIVHPTVSILPHLGYFPLPKSGSYPLVNSIDALDGYRETMVMMANKTTAMSRSRSPSGNLRSWGSNWKCVKQ